MEPPTIETIRRALRQVKDPEINLSVIDLGLIYDIGVSAQGVVDIKMTLTSPGCPSGPEMLADVERVVRALDGVNEVNVELVWEPYWTPERMDPKVRAFLGY
jgi:metal-sulfur cluster biosynthetic enzyme